MKLTCKREGNGMEKCLNKLNNMKKVITKINLDEFGKLGVEKLKANTPVDTGKTRDSWSYRIEKNKTRGISKLIFENSNTVEYGMPVVILLRYGHATKDGAWIAGNDFISPAYMQVFDELIKEINSIN